MKQKRKVFHSGIQCIDKFEFYKNGEDLSGVHFGGIFSSLEAAVRKANSYSKKKDELIYIHECELVFNNEEHTHCMDLGSNEDWYQLIEEIEEHINVIEYMNEYEPDINPSWYVLDESLISLVKVRQMTVENAERILELFGDGLITSVTF